MTGKIELGEWIISRRRSANIQKRIQEFRISQLWACKGSDDVQVCMLSFVKLFEARAELDLLNRLEVKLEPAKYKIQKVKKR